jgi:hypothetical protein
MPVCRSFGVPDLLILNLAEPGGPAGSAPFSAAKVTPAGALFPHYSIYLVIIKSAFPARQRAV